MPVTIFNVITKEIVEFSTITQACDHMEISSTYFKYYLNKQPIKGFYTIVKLGNVELSAIYTGDTTLVNFKAHSVYVTNADTFESKQFPSITKAAEFLCVTKSYLSRCIRQNKSCKAHIVKLKTD